ncbi:MAG TPA: M3 family metallopeptidase, partial [Clostridia bacterium]
MMPLPTEWDLTILFDGFDDPRFEQDFARAEKHAAETLAFISTLGHTHGREETVHDLEEVIARLQALLDPVYRVSAYVSLVLATDATNVRAIACQDRDMLLHNQVAQVQSALCRYAGSLENLQELLSATPALAEHAFLLLESARLAAHVLPPELEPIVLRMQMNGGQAFGNLRYLLDGTHQVDMVRDGQPVSLPLSTVRGMAYDPDPAVRKEAYEAELASYKKIEIPMAACLNAVKGEAQTICDLRGYTSILEETLAGQRLDRATLDVMLTAMEESLPDFRRYLRAKARTLGHPGGLPFYDLFAPVGKTSRRFTYEESHAYLVGILGRFSEKMAAFVDHAYRNRWIDALPHAGKGGGAFCAPIPPLKVSRVLCNFDGSFSSVSTIAHELGHAYHGDCLKEGSL